MPGLQMTVRQLLAAVVVSMLGAIALFLVPVSPIRTARAASITPCPSYWYVSYGGLSSWTLLNIDPSGLPLSALRFDRGYSDPTDLSKGFLDFNRDSKSDIFSAVPIGGGNYRWRYSSGGTSPWIDLAFDSTLPDQLRFGDFNGDGFTDVFSITPIGGGVYQWRYSPGGANSYVNLAQAFTTLDQLRLGDFNADGRTDVFTLTDLGGGSLGWNVSYSGTTSYAQINSAPTPLSEMKFLDVNQDGHTDVFTTISNTTFGQWQWFYSSAGTGAYQSIGLIGLSVHDITPVGHFTPDVNATGSTRWSDFFFTTLLGNNSYQWSDFRDQTNPSFIGSSQLAFDSTPPDQLRFADFNGDGVTDVFKLVSQCTSYLPLIRR